MNKELIKSIRWAFVIHPVPSPKNVGGERYWDERNAIEKVLTEAEHNGNN